MRHIINRQTFELDCGSEESAKTASAEIENFVIRPFTEIISHVLENFAGDGRMVMIDKIEIDLGEVEPGEMESPAMQEKFKQLLEVELRHQISPQKTEMVQPAKTFGGSSVRGSIELLSNWLQKGDLPWWAEKSNLLRIDGIFRNLFSQDRSGLSRLISEIPEDILFSRLLCHLSPSSLEKLEGLHPSVGLANVSASIISKKFRESETVDIVQWLSRRVKAFLRSENQVVSKQNQVKVFEFLMTQFEEIEKRNQGVFSSAFQRNAWKSIKSNPLADLSAYQLGFVETLSGIIRELEEEKYQLESREIKEPDYAGQSLESRAASPTPGEEIFNQRLHIASDYRPINLDNEDLPKPYSSAEQKLKQEDLPELSKLSADKKEFADDSAAEMPNRELPLGDATIITLSDQLNKIQDFENSPESVETPKTLPGKEQIKKHPSIESSFPELTPPAQPPSVIDSEKINTIIEIGDALSDIAASLQHEQLNSKKAASTRHSDKVSFSDSPAVNQHKMQQEIQPSAFYQILKQLASIFKAKRNLFPELFSGIIPESADDSQINPDQPIITAELGSDPKQSLSELSIEEAKNPEIPRPKTIASDESEFPEPQNISVYESGFPEPQTRTSNETEFSGNETIAPDETEKLINYILSRLEITNPGIKKLFENLPRIFLNQLAAEFKTHDLHQRRSTKNIKAFLRNYPLGVAIHVLKLYPILETKSGEKVLKPPAKKVARKRHASPEISAIKLSNSELFIFKGMDKGEPATDSQELRLMTKLLRKLPEEGKQFINFLCKIDPVEIKSLFAENMSKQNNLSFPHDQQSLTGTNEKLYIENAGLCLVAVYLGGFFKQLGFTEKGKFKNRAKAGRAVQLLEFIATGKKNTAEFQLQLNKILCGMTTFETIPPKIRLTKKETDEAEQLLAAVLEHWKTLKATSIDGFRTSFLQRKGILEEDDLKWTLRVEKQGFDMLLNTIPWGYTLIKLPWMKKHLQVEW